MNNKELVKLFKQSVKQVCDILQIEPHLLKRDLYMRTAIDSDVPRLNKVQLNDLGGFKAARECYFPISKQALKQQATKEEELRVRQYCDKIVTDYSNYIVENGFTPNSDDLEELNIPVKDINKYFGSIGQLHTESIEKNPEVDVNTLNETSFTPEAWAKLNKTVKNHKRFVLTTVVAGKYVPKKNLQAIENYLEENDAALLLLPCQDQANRAAGFTWQFDPKLRGYDIVWKDLYLNSNFYINSILVSAKQIQPLTGLDRLAQAKGSMALASPKQYLEFIANSNEHMPRALMTTGAITEPDYSSDKYMSQRTSYLAEFDHTMGGVIVEIVDDKFFHFRQFQFDKDGSFIDLAYQYNPDGSVEEVFETKTVLGDSHVGVHDLDVFEAQKDIVEYTNTDELLIHDIFDNRFNNHHETSKPIIQAAIALEGKSSLMKEGKMVSNYLNDWSEQISNITIVKSNHDEALERYLDEGRFIKDKENCYFALELARKRIEGEDVLKHLVVDMVGIEQPHKIKWLDRDEDYIVYGIQNGSHGDKGGNGSRGSLKGIEKAYYKATVGHSHTAGILRNIFQVGTSTVLKLHYNRGPSSWTHTICLQYPNGTRQLINIIKKNGVPIWKLED